LTRLAHDDARRGKDQELVGVVHGN
jgi:hypothetical protein